MTQINYILMKSGKQKKNNRKRITFLWGWKYWRPEQERTLCVIIISMHEYMYVYQAYWHTSTPLPSPLLGRSVRPRAQKERKKISHASGTEQYEKKNFFFRVQIFQTTKWWIKTKEYYEEKKRHKSQCSEHGHEVARKATKMTCYNYTQKSRNYLLKWFPRKIWKWNEPMK